MLSQKASRLACLLLAVSAVLAAPASASTYFHAGTSTGNVLPTGTGIDGNLQSGTSAVISTSSGNVTCTTGSIAATVGASGGATVATTVGTFNFTTCTDTIAFVTYNSCALYQAKQGVATATSASGGTLAVEMILRCDVGGGLFCYFHTSGSGSQATGVYDNAASKLTFANQSIALTTTDFSGAALPNQSGICPATATFTSTFAPVKVTSSGVIVVLDTTP